MRVFGRFLYALLAVGLFLLVFTYSIDLTANKFYEEVFGTSLVDEDSTLPEFYYFYTSIPDFHKEDPIVSVDKNGYIIRGYEIARADINNDNEMIVKESIYFIVYSQTQDLSKVDKIKLSDNLESEAEFNLARFKTLNITNGVNENGNVYLDKEFFLASDFNEIELIDKSGEVLISDSYNIDASDFTIKENLDEFYQENDRIPTEEDIDLLRDDNIALQIVHVSQDTKLDGSIMLVAMVGYFLVLIITTYLIFFKKRKFS